MYHGSCHAYDGSLDRKLCYSIKEDGEVGYCYASWYRNEAERTEWENLDDPSWNYISVSDFIAKCDGVSPDQTEISLEGLL